MPDRELARLRARIAEEPAPPELAEPGAAVALLARTEAAGVYPTTAAVFYACRVQRLLGTEVEGGAGVLSDAPDGLIRALNVGAKVPPVGTLVVLTSVASRWVFRYD